MPFCGYDPLMGDAVRTLAEGLTRSMRERAKMDGLDLASQLTNEARELRALRDLMAVAIDPSGNEEANSAQSLLGVVLVIRYLMQPSAEPYVDREHFEQLVRKRAEQLDQKMRVFEQTFYIDACSAPFDDRLVEALRRAVAA
jgi:hypothetical protein